MKWVIVAVGDVANVVLKQTGLKNRSFLKKTFFGLRFIKEF